jgi:hypothetical protein
MLATYSSRYAPAYTRRVAAATRHGFKLLNGKFYLKYGQAAQTTRRHKALQGTDRDSNSASWLVHRRTCLDNNNRHVLYASRELRSFENQQALAGIEIKCAQPLDPRSNKRRDHISVRIPDG